MNCCELILLGLKIKPSNHYNLLFFVLCGQQYLNTTLELLISDEAGKSSIQLNILSIYMVIFTDDALALQPG